MTEALLKSYRYWYRRSLDPAIPENERDHAGGEAAAYATVLFQFCQVPVERIGQIAAGIEAALKEKP